MLKALLLVHFWRVLLLKEQMMTSVRKTLKHWSHQRRSDRFLAKFALKITTKSAVFYRLLFGEVCLENSREIGWFFREFIPKNAAKFDFFFRDLSEALVISWVKTSLLKGFSWIALRCLSVPNFLQFQRLYEVGGCMFHMLEYTLLWYIV